MKRLWGIRHIRWLVLAWRVDSHVRRMASVGLGIAVNPSDVEVLDAIWRGER